MNKSDFTLKLQWQPALFIVGVLCLFFFHGSAAFAQLVGSDTAPGSSCAGYPTGAARMTADADTNGQDVVLICNGTTWEVDSSGGGLSANSVLESHLKAVDTPSDEECLTYETTTGDFEWQSCGVGGGGIWSDSGNGYIEYDSASYGGILVGGMTGLPAPAMP